MNSVSGLAEDTMIPWTPCWRRTSLACEAKELSPALQRWGSVKNEFESRRDGTLMLLCRAYGTRSSWWPAYPALKRWAKLFRAYGAHARSISPQILKVDLYQGTTLVVPQRAQKIPALAAETGAKAQRNKRSFSARLKPCPDTKQFRRRRCKSIPCLPCLRGENGC